MLIFFAVIFLFLPLAVAVAKHETERQLIETARVLELTIAKRGPDSEEWSLFFREIRGSHAKI